MLLREAFIASPAALERALVARWLVAKGYTWGMWQELKTLEECLAREGVAFSYAVELAAAAEEDGKLERQARDLWMRFEQLSIVEARELVSDHGLREVFVARGGWSLGDAREALRWRRFWGMGRKPK